MSKKLISYTIYYQKIIAQNIISYDTDVEMRSINDTAPPPTLENIDEDMKKTSRMAKKGTPERVVRNPTIWKDYFLLQVK